MTPLLDIHGHPVIGHRGASGAAPENTIAAFQAAVEQGADAIEFDVRLSSDGIPMVFHDPTLGRTTDRSDPVAALTAEALGRLDAGFSFRGAEDPGFPFRGKGLGVPRVEEIFERFPGLPMLIEVKEIAAAEPLADLIRRRGEGARVVVASFLEAALPPFRRTPRIATGASRRGIALQWVASWPRVSLKGRDDCYAVPDRYRDRVHVPTPAFLAAARRAGRPVHIWTVNDPERAIELWRRGASGMITNYPGLLLDARKRLML
jgi:glycerophosphoryl diester phosphodiesterase